MENTLLPLITTSSPSKLALVTSSVTAEPASGSLMPSEMSFSPFSKPGNQRAFWVGLAYSTKVRMGPKLPACTMSALLGHARATSWMANTACIKVPP